MGSTDSISMNVVGMKRQTVGMRPPLRLHKESNLLSRMRDSLEDMKFENLESSADLIRSDCNAYSILLYTTRIPEQKIKSRYKNVYRRADRLDFKPSTTSLAALSPLRTAPSI